MQITTLFIYGGPLAETPPFWGVAHGLQINHQGLASLDGEFPRETDCFNLSILHRGPIFGFH